MNLFALFIIVLLVWLWLDGARARELAVAISAAACQKRHLQFLDETVSLARMGIRRTAYGLRIRRMFSFDYSLEGTGRRTGHIILVGTELELLDLGLPSQDDTPDDEDTAVAKKESKIITFPKRH